MSNSVAFLSIAVGLSFLGSLVVWIHGRPRRSRSSVDHFHRGLRALSLDGGRHEPLSGVTLRRDEPVQRERTDTPPVGPSAARSPRPSPRPTPRPAARARPLSSEREETPPGS
jgi:hypothetical protein